MNQGNTGRAKDAPVPNRGGDLLQQTFAGLVLLDRYEVISFISQGAWGLVFKGTDRLMTKPVAIKFLQSHLAQDENKLARFEREAELASKFTHPNIVRIYGYGIKPLPFIVMEFVSGISLKEAITKAPLPALDAVPMFMEICRTVQAAHELGLVHRDIKPSNIMLNDQTKNGQREIKVLDFGLAKMFVREDAAQLTASGEAIGTPAYSSPEQIMGKVADARSDIYSMGCLMYETLTGVTPFGDSNIYECMKKHLTELPAPFNEANKTIKIPSYIENIVARAMAKDPTSRYRSMHHLEEALESAMRRLSRPQTTFDDDLQNAASSPAGKIVAAVVVLALILAIGGFVVMSQQQNATPNQKESSEQKPPETKNRPATAPKTHASTQKRSHKKRNTK